MTNPLDPALFRPDAVTPEIRALNDSLVQVLTPMPEWWVTGAETARAARRRGDGPFPPPVPLTEAREGQVPAADKMLQRLPAGVPLAVLDELRLLVGGDVRLLALVTISRADIATCSRSMPRSPSNGTSLVIKPPGVWMTRRSSPR